MLDQIGQKVEGDTEMPTTKVNQILERMRTAAGVDSNKRLAEFMGLDPQVTTGAKKRGDIPSIWLVKMSARTKVSIDWLLYGSGPMHLGEEAREDQPQFTASKVEVSRLTDDDVAFLGRLIDLVYSILTLGGQQQLGESKQLVLFVSMFCKLFFNLPNRIELLEQFRDMSIERFKKVFGDIDRNQDNG